MNATVHDAGRRVTARALASWAVFAIAFLAWFVLLAPTAVGGHTVFVLVTGHSMEPMLHTGDLAVIRTQDSYAIGDLVLMQVHGGQVIHRLIAGSAATVWETKGDNNSWIDPWTVPDADLVGTYAYMIPQFGTALTWLRQHPVQFGLVCGLLVALRYLPWRRRRISPVLATALVHAEREPRRGSRPGGELGALVMCAFGALLALGFVGRLLASHLLWSPAGAIALVSLAWAGSLTTVLIYRLFDGRGVAEPAKSLNALSGRLYSVDALPATDPPAMPVSSAVHLRDLAEHYRLPVLHVVDPTSRQHTFMLLTDRHGCFVWPADAPAQKSARVVVTGPQIAIPASTL